MPRFDLLDGGYVGITDPALTDSIEIEVADWRGDSVRVQLSGLDELDGVISMLANPDQPVESEEA